MADPDGLDDPDDPDRMLVLRLGHPDALTEADTLLAVLEGEGLRARVVERTHRATGGAEVFLVHVAVWAAQNAGAAVIGIAVDRAVRAWRDGGAEGGLSERELPRPLPPPQPVPEPDDPDAG